jgi:hypothetical protein
VGISLDGKNSYGQVANPVGKKRGDLTITKKISEAPNSGGSLSI